MAWAPIAAAGVGLLGNSLLNRGGDKMRKVQMLSKPQQALLSQLLGMVGNQGGVGQGAQQATAYQQEMLNPSAESFNRFTQPFMDQYQNQVIPGLAERFAGAGAMGGGLSSSGFAQSLGAAGSQLQNQLAALKANLGQQAAQSLMGQYGQLSGIGLNASPFAYQKRAPSAASGFLQGYAQQGYPGLQQGANSLSDWWSNNGPIIGNV